LSQEWRQGRNLFVIMRFNILLLLVFFYLSSCYSQKAVEIWSFEGEKPLLSDNNNFELKHAMASYKINVVDGVKGRGIQAATDQNAIVTNLFARFDITQDFALGFYFKGSNYTYTSFPSTVFRISLNYAALNLLFPTNDNAKVGQIQIPLKGTGITSFDYLANGWHHWLFVFKKNGDITIYIDGQTTKEFRVQAKGYRHPPKNINDGFRTSGMLDEIEFYNTTLPEGFIAKAYGKKISTLAIDNKKRSNELIPWGEGFLDKKEFAPGYPDYTISALDQLKNFPSPRYSPSQKLPRNFPWVDITYLHRVVTDTSQRMGNVHPDVAVTMMEEMVNRWNYYFELPVLRVDSATAQKRYTDTKDVYYHLIKYANAHPEVPVATITHQLQNKGIHAGFNVSGPHLSAQNLNDKFFLQDASGKVIVYKNKKWFNPFTADEIFEKDGKISAFYINQLGKHLKRKIDFINENGEWYGHNWPDELLDKSPQVVEFKKKNNLDNHSFNGWMLNRFDSVYKASLLKSLPWKDIKFTFYNVSAYNPAYWPDYSKRIYTNSTFNGMPRSTPAFYPARPDNWRMSDGALNGYGTVAEGRKKEIELGVKLFAPFISAGWNVEEKNIRPGQWLGLLKAMVMMGADFFHVGYFNTTAGGGWPNKKGPNDPRGYMYQVALPGYAQAIASQVYPFLLEGELLDPQEGANLRGNTFKFRASQENHLVMVRKWKGRYLIFGSVQPNSNYVGNAAEVTVTEIELEGKKIKFEIRRQGSMYIYIPGNTPKFIQLDKWHQREHPSYWSVSYPVEAENAGNISVTDNSVITENVKGNDFSTAVSYVKLTPSGNLKFDLDILKDYTSVSITLRSAKGGAVKVQAGDQQNNMRVSGDNWKTIKIPLKLSRDIKQLMIVVTEGEVDIDKIEFN
jgi:hypothetical protein